MDKDGQQSGPVGVAKLGALFQEGEIDGMALVWHSELPGGWKPLAEVSELSRLLGSRGDQVLETDDRRGSRCF